MPEDKMDKLTKGAFAIGFFAAVACVLCKFLDDSGRQSFEKPLNDKDRYNLGPWKSEEGSPAEIAENAARLLRARAWEKGRIEKPESLPPYT